MMNMGTGMGIIMGAGVLMKRWILIMGLYLLLIYIYLLLPRI